MFRILLFVFFIICNLTWAQHNIINDFDPPIRIPLKVSGTFGELRNNHFHAGVDFSSNFKIGDPIYAPADGVVNRIKVSAFGYGKAVYIRHRNGYTTVYGHLSAYSDKIGKYVKEHHYQQQKFEIELFPLAEELPVKKGEIIGYIGNTGGSGGPHLHYEIRDTNTEHIINALAFSLKDKVLDTEHAIINGVFVYPLNNETIINNSSSSFEVALTKSNNSYRGKTIRANGAIGFGIHTHDTQNGSRGKNGVYQIITYINGVKSFEIVFDEFSFNDSKYINQYIDYKYYKLTGNRIQKLFTTADIPLKLIKTQKNKGQVFVKEHEDINFKIEVLDVHQNKQVIEIPIKYQEYPIPEKPLPKGKYIDCLKDYIFEEENVSVQWNARTFFEDVYLNIELGQNKIVLHKDEYAVSNNINIKIMVPENYPNKNRTFIGKTDGKRIKYFDTWKRGNDFRIRTKELGTYELVQDTENPTIRFINDSDIFKAEDHLVFEIEDNLAGIGSYEGYLNDNWILFEYDYKTKKLIHKLSDEKFTSGTNVLKLVVTDRVGNSTTFEHTIEVN